MRSKTAKPAGPLGIKNPLEGPIEGIRDFGKAVSTEVTDDLVKGGANDFMKQLLGIDVAATMKPVAQEKKAEAPKAIPGGGPVEVFNAKNHQGEVKSAPKAPEKPKKAEARKEAHINYHGETTRSSERSLQSKNRSLDERISDIQSELAKEVLSSPKLKTQFAEIGVNQAHAKAGVGTVNFLEFVLKSVREAKQNTNDSGAWLKTTKGKNGKKGSYDPSNGMQHSTGEKTTIQNAAG